MNESDSERIAAVLENSGLKSAKTEDEADFIIINMCSVRQKSVDKIFRKIEELRKKNKKIHPVKFPLSRTSKRRFNGVKILLTGCFLESNKKEFEKITDFIFKIDEVQNLPKILHIRAENQQLKTNHYLDVVPKYPNNDFAYVPIMAGCNNFCSYCVVPYTRGREISRPDKDITSEIKKLLKNGYKTIWLLGQNVNSYKYKNLNFPKLLKKIEKIPGNFEVGFLTSHPKDFSDELIKTIKKSKKIKKYIHLPVQAGNNKILKKMNRGYTKEHYLSLIDKIRKEIPDAELSTDIIVGFPGETKKDFAETVNLVKKVNFCKAYINKYSPRPGTVAGKLKDNVPKKEKERREKILREMMKSANKNNLLVVLGPTASGKSKLAVKIAHKFNGEIISADSRQVYHGMNIGTGKITRKEMKGIPHYLLDVVSPKRTFSVAQYKKLAESAIKKIKKKNKIPILCGGTGFYIQAVVDEIEIPKVKPDWKLRRNLEKKSNEELFKMLKKLDPRRAKEIDKNNPRRLIRAIEILLKTKKLIPKIKKSQNYDVLIIGIKKEKEELKKLINIRLKKWIKKGLIIEVKKLKKSGLSWKKIENFGLEYFWIAKYLQNKISLEESIEKSKKDIEKYTRRQMAWFNKDKRIKWIKNYKEAEKLIKNFL